MSVSETTTMTTMAFSISGTAALIINPQDSPANTANKEQPVLPKNTPKLLLI
eukprot:CAMPEP_0178949572 /NCGR_PEP_ID=MMETSP0789-20121207/6125_1 /TAXON_ID=3005 /ORGANISM="Rhizosolenia setigera, Strain CCMP 1694" /LENGTH=51 /DNA_ID=CAMNT_0020630109 /DNA_START=41 /DNA_END=193 /DNA_ORIENTATION=-